VQYAKIIGVADESVNQVKLRLLLRWQHRARVDALRPSPEHPAVPPEDGTERTLGNVRNLPDEIELIILQPYANARIELGQHLERLRSEKTSFVS
jgi:hypothetical protein